MRLAAALLAATVVLLVAAGGQDGSPPRSTATASAGALPLESGTAPLPIALRLADPVDEVRDSFTRPPRAAVLFDVDSGNVLWRRNPTRRRPIASLTKIMTALVVADRLPEGTRVRVSARALNYAGSGVGVLPRGRRVDVDALLHGLLLPSGNDAARVLAEGAGGGIRRFVRLMNRRAARMGLPCTRFSAPDGLTDAGNRSCAADLAAMARALLREPRLARIVRRPSAVLPLPGKPRRMWLYNNNPLLRAGYRGATGVKTGFTDAAGRCLVATARRGGVHLGVVLLHSPDPGRQAEHLLDRGFAAMRDRRRGDRSG